MIKLLQFSLLFNVIFKPGGNINYRSNTIELRCNRIITTSNAIVTDIFNTRLKEIILTSFEGKSILSKDSCKVRKIMKDTLNMVRELKYIINNDTIITNNISRCIYHDNSMFRFLK